MLIQNAFDDKIRDKIGISLAQFRNNMKWNSKWQHKARDDMQTFA